MTEVRFDCTACGKCCHGLKLPMSIADATAWAARGDRVQVLCEATPWPEEPDQSDLPMQYKRARSFAAMSGDLPMRISVTLAAAFDGPCPNLGADMLCGIYEERPTVCRIYPAEINPFVELDPASKQCPPEAWGDDQPVLIRNGDVVDPETVRLIDKFRRSAIDDTEPKAQLCAALGIVTAALANEGLAIAMPSPEDLLAAIGALEQAQPPASSWRVVSNRAATIEMLMSAGAQPVASADAEDMEYIGFFPAA